MSYAITTQALRLPSFLFDYWQPRKVAEKNITEAAVLKLLREAKISSGKAAELLDMPRWEFWELMSKHNISMVNLDSSELKKQIKDYQKTKSYA